MRLFTIGHSNHSLQKLINLLHDNGINMLVDEVTEDRKERSLQNTIFNDAGGILGAPILSGPGFYIMKGSGMLSLGTIKPQRIIRVIYQQAQDQWKYRLILKDGQGSIYQLTVTD